MKLTPERLREVLSYDPKTGIFTWISPLKNSRRPVGSAAGCINSLGYVQIGIDCGNYAAHRLAWMYMYGDFPETDIDHINGNPSDNRIDNLRAVTHQQNMCNRKLHKNNSSGYPGVYFYKQSKKWRACIKVNGKKIHLGLFNSAKEAHDKYVKASKEYHSNYGRERP